MNLDILPNEVWVDVPGYEGLYKISNMGRVYGVVRGSLKKPYNRDYCLVVSLYKDGVSNSYKLAELVYDAFARDSKVGQIHFKDNDPLNCAFDNLFTITDYEDQPSDEVWKPVYLKDFPGYEVSNLGNVRKIGSSRLLKSYINHEDPRVSLYNAHTKKLTSVFVARLVYNSFCGTNKKKFYFKDGNHLNVQLDNLI